MATIHRFTSSKKYRADIARLGNDIGKKIGEARREAKLTQANFAIKLKEYGVYVQTPAVNKWESGETVPNAYQLIAIIHALGIKEGLAYFTGHVPALTPALNPEGRRIAKAFLEFLESQDKYTRSRKRFRKKKVRTSIEKVSAGLGEGLMDDNYFENVDYPESVVPDGTDFAVIVDGDSMEPAYHDGQAVFVEACESLDDGEVGVFLYEQKGYLKVYREMEPLPEDIDDLTDDNGIVHPQIWLVSYNDKKYNPIKVTDELRIFGRVLN